MAPENRRQHPRAEVPRLRLRFPRGRSFEDQLLRDLSVGGVFAYTEHTLPVGSELDIQIIVAEHRKPFLARGRVTRIQVGGEPSGRGMAVQFIELPTELAGLLGQVVASLQPGSITTSALQPTTPPPELTKVVVGEAPVIPEPVRKPADDLESGFESAAATVTAEWQAKRLDRLEEETVGLRAELSALRERALLQVAALEEALAREKALGRRRESGMDPPEPAGLQSKENEEDRSTEQAQQPDEQMSTVEESLADRSLEGTRQEGLEGKSEAGKETEAEVDLEPPGDAARTLDLETALFRDGLISRDRMISGSGSHRLQSDSEKKWSSDKPGRSKPGSSAQGSTEASGSRSAQADKETPDPDRGERVEAELEQKATPEVESEPETGVSDRTEPKTHRTSGSAEEPTLGPEELSTREEFVAHLEGGARFRPTERFFHLEPVSRNDIQVIDWLKEEEHLESLRQRARARMDQDELMLVLHMFFERGLIRITA